PMTAENSLMELIREGKYDEIHLSPFSRMDMNLGTMALDPLTQHTYLTVSAISLFSRTAIGAGVRADDAFDLSDALLFFLSYYKTSDEVYEIYQLSAVMFAKQVHQTKEKKPSYQTERVLNYIARNIYRKITIQDVADYVGLAPNYLCRLFSKEMGISLYQYIQREKITISCNLLRYTDRSISDIATYMGFQTQSNFTAVFRKWQNMTPTQYREENYRETY
ncbi:MAG: AraC family transcriptional regulator, partial [Lachnospiraceae bacterium]|nr:AraC family transcriptional regulator [Lachnospiraceae bacterium]